MYYLGRGLCSMSTPSNYSSFCCIFICLFLVFISLSVLLPGLPTSYPSFFCVFFTFFISSPPVFVFQFPSFSSSLTVIPRFSSPSLFNYFSFLRLVLLFFIYPFFHSLFSLIFDFQLPGYEN